MKAKSTYQIMMEMKQQAIVEKEKVTSNIYPDTFKRVLEMQQEKVPCIVCNRLTNTDVHVEYRGGMSVFTKYVCPYCKTEFMEKDLHQG